MVTPTFSPTNREDVLASYNLGANTLTMRLPISRFIDLTDVPNEGAVSPSDVSQRPLDRAHATALAVYILKGLVQAAKNLRGVQNRDATTHLEILERMGSQSYFSLQPIVVNLPVTIGDLKFDPQKNAVGDELTWRVSLPPGVIMWVVDGQHRRFALGLVLEFLRHVVNSRTYPKRASLYPYNGEGIVVSPKHLEVWRECHSLALGHCTVTIEAHLGLDVGQQRQLFHDLNNMGKSVAAGMAFDYDQSNPINIFIKDTLIKKGVLKAKVVEKDIVDWSTHDGSMTRKDLVAVNSILFINKTNPKGASPVQVEKMSDTAARFWQSISAIPGFGDHQAKLKTVAAQPVVLKALAKLTFDFAEGRKSANDEHLDRLLDGIGEIDFSHDNPMWQPYELSDADRLRKVPGLEAYLPAEEGNRDLGSRDEAGHMRFGAKHNDIFPILGDVIRWRLDLPSRHVDEAGAKEAAAA